MKRAFVAIDLPAALKERLTSATPPLPKGVRPVPPDQIHLTLRFLGNVDDAAFPVLVEALGKITAPAFAVRLDAPGTFPPTGEPHVLWMGLADSEPLGQLRARIDDAAFAAGLPRDDRPFSAHITIARLRDTRRKSITDVLEALAGLGPIEIPVPAFTLYTSVLTNTGATHTAERVYGLS